MTAATATTIMTIEVWTNISVSFSDTTSLNRCPLIVIESVEPNTNVSRSITNVNPNVIIDIFAAGTPLTFLSLESRLRSPAITAKKPIMAATTRRTIIKINSASVSKGALKLGSSTRRHIVAYEKKQCENYHCDSHNDIQHRLRYSLRRPQMEIFMHSHHQNPLLSTYTLRQNRAALLRFPPSGP